MSNPKNIPKYAIRHKKSASPTAITHTRRGGKDTVAELADNNLSDSRGFLAADRSKVYSLACDIERRLTGAAFCGCDELAKTIKHLYVDCIFSGSDNTDSARRVVFDNDCRFTVGDDFFNATHFNGLFDTKECVDFASTST